MAQNNPYAAFQGMSQEQLAGMGRIRDASPTEQARVQGMGQVMNQMRGQPPQNYNNYQRGNDPVAQHMGHMGMGNYNGYGGYQQQMGQMQNQQYGMQNQQAQYRPQMNQMQNQMRQNMGNPQQQMRQMQNQMGNNQYRPEVQQMGQMQNQMQNQGTNGPAGNRMALQPNQISQAMSQNFRGGYKPPWQQQQQQQQQQQGQAAVNPWIRTGRS